MSEESMEKQLAEEAEAFLSRLHEKYSMEQQNKIMNHIFTAIFRNRKSIAEQHEKERQKILQSSSELALVIENTLK